MTMTMTMRFDKYMLSSLMFSTATEDFNTNLRKHLEEVTKLLQNFKEICKKLKFIYLSDKTDMTVEDIIALNILSKIYNTKVLENEILRQLSEIYVNVSYMFSDGVLPEVLNKLVLSIISREDEKNVLVILESGKKILNRLANLFSKRYIRIQTLYDDNFNTIKQYVEYSLTTYITTLKTATIDGAVVIKLQDALNIQPRRPQIEEPMSSYFTENFVLISTANNNDPADFYNQLTKIFSDNPFSAILTILKALTELPHLNNEQKIAAYTNIVLRLQANSEKRGGSKPKITYYNDGKKVTRVLHVNKRGTKGVMQRISDGTYKFVAISRLKLVKA